MLTFTFLLLLLVAACADRGGAAPGPGPGPDGGVLGDGGEQDGDVSLPDGDAGSPDGGTGGFYDHTFLVDDLPDAAALERLLVGPAARREVKLLITRFDVPGGEQARLLDGSFYGMHDEWYWFSLLNGQPVPGEDEFAPLTGHSFATVQQIVDWARLQEPASLPLDLEFGDGGLRLYSRRFYARALELPGEDFPRCFGIGTLLHVAPVPGVRPELWLFELEYSDAPTHALLVRFFTQLDAALPPEISGTIRWAVRSPAQEALAVQMEQQRLPYWDRLLRYSELAIPGETEVYNPGLSAGRLKVLRAGDPGLEESLPTDVLVLEAVPDFLPPAAGLITAVPQTQLAHINLLARNRGIPNGYRGGILEDAGLLQLARGYAPVLVHAAAPDLLEILPLEERQYARYRSLSSPVPLDVPQVDLAAAPQALPLAGLQPEAAAGLRPLLGGKNAGTIFLAALLPGEEGPVAAPHRPVAITVKPYFEHLAPLRERIAAMLAEPEFRPPPSWPQAPLVDERRASLVRLLVLEGLAAFDAREPSAAAALVRAAILARPPGDVLGDLVREGGLRQVIRSRPIAGATLAEIRAVLLEAFGGYARTQGLRFRSSSNIEDAEGFNGAGLYESFTGFLWPEEQARAADRSRTIERAILDAWACYWSAEAFAERRLALADHLAGGMGVLVHARFDDAMELANGVITYTFQPPGSPRQAVMDVNVQVGSLSVTNPAGGALPEVDRLVQAAGPGGEEPTIERVRPSTELDAGEHVLTDEELRGLYAQVRAVAESWRAQANAGLNALQRRTVVVLDLELRKVAAGWPARPPGGGAPFPARLVLKQVRSLDPGLPRLADPAAEAELLGRPFPRDLLARARRVDERVCSSESFTLWSYEANTDPARLPDMGHADSPFTALVLVAFHGPLPALGIPAGHRAGIAHPGFRRAEHPGMGPGTWALQLELTPDAAAQARFDTLAITPEGAWRMAAGEASAAGVLTCRDSEPVFATPADYLTELLLQSRG